MTNEILEGRLLELPQIIFHAEMDIIREQNKLEDLRDEKSKWELQQRDEIANQVNDDGKPLYSNDEKRRAELERRKESSVGYQTLSANVRNREYGISTMRLDIARLEAEQRNLRSICDLRRD